MCTLEFNFNKIGKYFKKPQYIVFGYKIRDEHYYTKLNTLLYLVGFVIYKTWATRKTNVWMLLTYSNMNYVCTFAVIRMVIITVYYKDFFYDLKKNHIDISAIHTLFE